MGGAGSNVGYLNGASPDISVAPTHQVSGISKLSSDSLLDCSIVRHQLASASHITRLLPRTSSEATPPPPRTLCGH